MILLTLKVNRPVGLPLTAISKKTLGMFLEAMLFFKSFLKKEEKKRYTPRSFLFYLFDILSSRTQGAKKSEFKNSRGDFFLAFKVWLYFFFCFHSFFFHYSIMPRSAWKGPFFVAFPGLRQAVQNGTPIATQGKHMTLILYVNALCPHCINDSLSLSLYSS